MFSAFDSLWLMVLCRCHEGFQMDYPGGGIFREQFEMFFMGGAASKMADLVFRYLHTYIIPCLNKKIYYLFGLFVDMFFENGLPNRSSAPWTLTAMGTSILRSSSWL